MLAESMTVGRYWATCSFPMSFGHPLLASSDSCTRDRSKDRGTFYLRVCITNIRRFTQIPQPPAQPNFIILCAIMPGLVSSFFASSCSFWCFWLSLQGDSRASSPVGAHLWHKTRLLFLFVPGDTRLTIHALIKAWSKKTNWLVVSTLKHLKVSWDVFFFEIWKNRTCSKTTNQQKSLIDDKSQGMDLRIGHPGWPLWLFRFAGWRLSWNGSQNWHSAKHQAWSD